MAPLMNRARVAALLLGLGFLALLGLGSVILVQVSETRGFTTGALRAQEARLTTVRVLALLQDAETGQRGYLLTGEPRYLDPYRAATASLQGALTRLTELIAAEGDSTEGPAALQAAAAEKLAELAETIARFDAGDADGALWIVRTDRGRAAMRRVRGIARDVETRITARIVAREAALNRANRRLLTGTAAALLLVLAVAAITGVLGWGYTRELHAAAAQVRALNEGLEARVAERTSDLAAANDEVQRFAYIVSHDLRAPLVNVMGFTSELQASLEPLQAQQAAIAAAAPELAQAAARTALDEDIPEALGFIRTSTERMDRLINAILRLSREGRRGMTPERIDMAALIEALAGTIQHQLAAAGATLTVEGRLPTLVADRLAVEQVFGNLIENAVKYLDPARPGRIVVRGRAVPRGRGAAAAVFEVEDNGRGIDARDHERIWELFRRAGNQNTPGEGIGLAHVRALVRRMGGGIDCDSALGRGSVFRVTLPVTATTSVAGRDEVSPSVHSRSLHGRRNRELSA